MIQVSFKSLCTNDAYKRTKKILDNFAIRTGEKTWETFTTYQVLNKLIKKLNNIASKNTCINIFIHHKNYVEHYITIGNKNLINEYNGIPISYTEINKNFNFNEEDINMVKSLLEFTTLFHDLGKNNIIFQTKIRNNSKKRDTIRHELLSCVFLYQFLIKEYSTFHFYEVNKSNELLNDVKKFLSFYFETYYNIIKNDNFLEDLEYINKYKKEILFFLLTSIILHHHKFNNEIYKYSSASLLFSPEIIIESIKNDFINVFFNKEDIAELNINIDFSENNWIKFDFNLSLEKDINLFKDFSDNFHINYMDKIYINFEKILKKIDINKNLLDLYFYITRSYLMFIDHFVSSKENDKDLLKTNYLIANKYQLLEEHLIEETKQTSEFLDFMNNGFETIKLSFQNIKTNKKFAWQDNAVKKISKKKGKNKKGSITILNAETGHGKTIGILKVMKELTDNNLRFNFLYGMRILSKQTYTGIVKFTNIQQKDISLIIGRNETDKETDIDYNQEDILSDLILEKDYQYVKQEIKNKKIKELIVKPTNIATIDYFTNIHKINKNKYLLGLFRISNSDLIIDEIDMFLEKEQIKILSHLLFISGLFKRNVILSSATIPKELASLYIQAYNEGYKLGNIFERKQTNYLINLINNFEQQVFDNDEYNENHLDVFYVNKLEYLNKEPDFNKKIAELIKYDYDNKDNLYKEIVEKIYELHKINKINVGNKYFSFGFVKFNYISDLIKFFNYIYNDNNLKRKDYYIKIQFLHGNLSEEYKEKIEKELNRYLNKNNNQYKEEIKKDIINIKEKNIIYILLTTPIIEVGKDFDFDWGITQYINSISLIQTAGRIYRHRTLKKKKTVMYYFLLNTVSNFSLKDKLYINNKLNINENIVLNSSYTINNLNKEFSKTLKKENEFGLLDIDYNLKFRKENSMIKSFEMENNKIIDSNDKTLIKTKIKQFELKTEIFLIENNFKKETYYINYYKGDKISNFVFNKYIGIVKI